MAVKQFTAALDLRLMFRRESEVYLQDYPGKTKLAEKEFNPSCRGRV